MSSFAFTGVPRKTGKEFSPAALGRDSRWRIEMARKQREIADRLRPAQTTVEACPICASEKFEPFVSVFEYSWVECADCGHLFCCTPVDAVAVAGLYSASDGRRSAQGDVYVVEELFRTRVEQIALPKARHVASVVRERGVWVDIGCGTGEMLMAARDLGWECRGVESDPDEIAFGRRHGLDISSGFVDASNAGEWVREARVVSLLNVLEHVRDPLRLLAAVAGMLAPGAYVVIEVPRHPSLSALANQAFPELACRHVYAPDHLHIFTESSAERLLRAASLRAISVWNFGQDFHDLTGTVIAARMPAAEERWQMLAGAAPFVQMAVDRAGLSDALFIVSRKE